MVSYVADFNARNMSLTAKLLQQGYRYHKLRKTFSKFYGRHYELVSKFNVGLKPLLHQGLSEPEFYGDLVYWLTKETLQTFFANGSNRNAENLYLLYSNKCNITTRATEILKSKSVRSTDDVIDVTRTWVGQSQIVTKTLHFHPKVYQKLIIFLIQSNSQPVVSKRSRANPELLA